MKTIKKESLPIPDKIPGPHSWVYFVKRDTMIGMAMEQPGVQLVAGACQVTPDVKIQAIIGIAKEVGAKRAFEIGTCSGATAANLYYAGLYVETIDLDQPLPIASHQVRFADEKEFIIDIPCGRLFTEGAGIPVVCHRGDTRTWEPNGLEKSFDLVFVDGDHTYGMAKNDTLLALRLMKPGGTIVWDDAAIDGVPRVLEEFEKEHGEVTIVECGCESRGRDWPIAYWRDR